MKCVFYIAFTKSFYTCFSESFPSAFQSISIYCYSWVDWVSGGVLGEGGRGESKVQISTQAGCCISFGGELSNLLIAFIYLELVSSH